jgi:hypothetical protein
VLSAAAYAALPIVILLSVSAETDPLSQLMMASSIL